MRRFLNWLRGAEVTQLRAQLEMCREDRDRFLAKVVELGMRNDALAAEVAMLRRANVVRELEVPCLPN